jgi:hypothetical protein
VRHVSFVFSTDDLDEFGIDDRFLCDTDSPGPGVRLRAVDGEFDEERSVVRPADARCSSLRIPTRSGTVWILAARHTSGKSSESSTTSSATASPRRQLRRLTNRSGKTLPAASPCSFARRAVELLVVFTGFAVVMAFVGTYGLMAYIVAQRMREFGIRGIRCATRRDPPAHHESESAHRFAGVLSGLLASIGFSRFLSTLLFEIKATDPVVYDLLSIGLILVALGAALIPAIRAFRHHPISLLSTDR